MLKSEVVKVCEIKLNIESGLLPLLSPNTINAGVLMLFHLQVQHQRFCPQFFRGVELRDFRDFHVVVH